MSPDDGEELTAIEKLTKSDSDVETMKSCSPLSFLPGRLRWGVEPRARASDRLLRERELSGAGECSGIGWDYHKPAMGQARDYVTWVGIHARRVLQQCCNVLAKPTSLPLALPS